MSLKTALTAAAVIALSIPVMAGPAAAASAQQQIAMCTDALDEQGLAPAGDYRSKFVKSKGGAVKTVTIKIYAEGTPGSLTAKCKIKGGEVIAADIS